VRVFYNQPQTLLKAIKAAAQHGSVETWEVDSDGDFTHSRDQWRNRAWFGPVIMEDRNIFKIPGPKSKTMSLYIMDALSRCSWRISI
jgi:hypothetical protein